MPYRACVFQHRSDYTHVHSKQITLSDTNFWRSCPALSNNDADCSESSSSLKKHRSQKRTAYMFASSWCVKVGRVRERVRVKIYMYRM